MCVLSLYKLVFKKSYAECYIEYKLDFMPAVKVKLNKFYFIEIDIEIKSLKN